MLVDYANSESSSWRKKREACVLVDQHASLKSSNRLWNHSDKRVFPGVPEELFDDLARREAVALDILSSDPRDGRFMFDRRDPEDRRRPSEARWKLDRDAVEATEFVKFAAPGYCDDGRLALVRFMIDPSAHGTLASYLMHSEDGRWTVLAKRIMHLM